MPVSVSKPPSIKEGRGEPVEINLSEKQSEAWHYLYDDITTEVLFGGAAGPGKTYFGCIWHINQRIQYPKSRGLIGRAKLKILEESTLVTFFQACTDMGYQAGTHFTYNGQKNTILWYNGSKTILKDLQYYPSDPNFTSLGSTEYTDAFIDEATEITLKSFEIINSRLRYKLDAFNTIPKILLTCNPGPGWVKERFVLKDGKPVALMPYQKFVGALLTDNPNPAFKAIYEQQLSRMTDDYDRQRLLHGDWEAVPEARNPFCMQYDKVRHEGSEAIFRDSLNIIMVFDFNIDPFAVNFYHMWKDEKGPHIHQFNEMSIKSGSIPIMCDLIRGKYGHKLATCLVSGDSTSRKRDISQRDNASHYQQIKTLLKLKDNQFRLTTNPTHSNSREDCNYLLANFPDFQINSSTCPDTCRDMKSVECDEFGSLIKKHRADITQQADHLDCFRYFVHSFCRPWIFEHQKRR